MGVKAISASSASVLPVLGLLSDGFGTPVPEETGSSPLRNGVSLEELVGGYFVSGAMDVSLSGG